MEFLDIAEEMKIYPGEYLLHKPTSEIVMCGAYKKSEGLIRFLARGRLKEDKLENFQKLKLTKGACAAEGVEVVKGSEPL